MCLKIELEIDFGVNLAFSNVTTDRGQCHTG